MPLVLSKKETNQKQEVGTLVKEYIEETRGELEQEKKELRSQVYKDDWNYCNIDIVGIKRIFRFLSKVVVKEFYFSIR